MEEALFSSALESSAVREVTEAVLDWQLRHPGRYAVWGHTAAGDAVALVLLGDGTIVRRAVQDGEKVQSSAPGDEGPGDWASFVRAKTHSEFTYEDLPEVVREAVEQDIGGAAGPSLNVASAFDLRGWEMGVLFQRTRADTARPDAV